MTLIVRGSPAAGFATFTVGGRWNDAANAGAWRSGAELGQDSWWTIVSAPTRPSRNHCQSVASFSAVYQVPLINTFHMASPCARPSIATPRDQRNSEHVPCERRQPAGTRNMCRPPRSRTIAARLPFLR